MVRRRSLALLMAADALWVIAALRLALAADSWRRLVPDATLDVRSFVHFSGVVATWLVALSVCGAYDRRFLALKGRNLSITMCGAAMATAATAGAFYLVPAWHMSRLAFLVMGIVGGCGLVCVRAFWLTRQRHAGLPASLGVGDPGTLAQVWREMLKARGAAIQPLVVVAPGDKDQGEAPPGVRLCTEEAAFELIREHGRNLTVLSDGRISSEGAARLLTQASLIGCTVADVFSFYEATAGRAPIFATASGWLFRVHHRAPDVISYAVKRLFDVVVCLLLLPVVVPVVALVAVLVKLTSPGPAFYVQRRMGYRGREFRLVKLRTMKIDAETKGAEWAVSDDPRVTPLGRLLRTTAIDELPQLWNVLRGDLSLVGPRPERPEVVSRMRSEIPPYMQRHMVPCGVTGWAQIHRGSDLTFGDVLDKVRLDLYYARNFSFWLDVLILLRTFQMLLARAKPAPAAIAAPDAATGRVEGGAESVRGAAGN